MSIAKDPIQNVQDDKQVLICCRDRNVVSRLLLCYKPSRIKCYKWKREGRADHCDQGGITIAGSASSGWFPFYKRLS